MSPDRRLPSDRRTGQGFANPSNFFFKAGISHPTRGLLLPGGLDLLSAFFSRRQWSERSVRRPTDPPSAFPTPKIEPKP